MFSRYSLQIIIIIIIIIIIVSRISCPFTLWNKLQDCGLMTVTPCSLVGKYLNGEETCSLRVQCRTLSAVTPQNTAVLAHDAVRISSLTWAPRVLHTFCVQFRALM